MLENTNLNYRGILKGILFSLLITVILVVIIAIITYFTDIPDGVISISLFLCSVISVMIGGLVVAKSANQKGLLHGGILGVGYYIIIMCASLIMKQGFSLSAHMIIMFFADTLGGMLGGILGINSKK